MVSGESPHRGFIEQVIALADTRLRSELSPFWLQVWLCWSWLATHKGEWARKSIVPVTVLLLALSVAQGQSESNGIEQVAAGSTASDSDCAMHSAKDHSGPTWSMDGDCAYLVRLSLNHSDGIAVADIFDGDLMVILAETNVLDESLPLATFILTDVKGVVHPEVVRDLWPGAQTHFGEECVYTVSVRQVGDGWAELRVVKSKPTRIPSRDCSG